MHEAQGPAGGCLIVLRNSVEKSALTTTMGLNKSMGLKDHVAENRLVWTQDDLLVCKNCSMAAEILPILALQNPSSHVE